MTEERVCIECGEGKPRGAFRQHRRRCKSCEAPAHRDYMRDYMRKRRAAKKASSSANHPAAPEAKLIGQLTQDEFAELLNRLLEERETALLLS